jgi:hypothetical protein
LISASDAIDLNVGRSIGSGQVLEATSMVDTKGTEQTAFTNVEFTAAQVSLYR